MAENFRHIHTEVRVMQKQAIEIAREARRQFENCLYTSAALHEWLKALKLADGLLTLCPLVFGSLATWKALDENDNKILISVFALLAALLPVVQKSLKLKEKITEISRAAGRFANLRDRFRQVAMISFHKDISELEADFSNAMSKLEEIRSQSVTSPGFAFRIAQRKIQSGDYDADFEDASPDAFTNKARERKTPMIRIFMFHALVAIMDASAIFAALFWALSANATRLVLGKSNIIPESANFLNVQSADFNWIAALLTAVVAFLIPITRWLDPK